MNHEQARQRWHDLVDKSGPDAELEAHLSRCDACRAYVRDMETVMRVLESARRDTERVEVGPPQAAAPPVAAWGWRAPLRAAAMIAVLIGIGYAALRLSNTKAPVERQPKVVEMRIPRPEGVPASFGVTLKGESAQRNLVVTDPHSTAEVQVYWLYSSLAQPAGGHETTPDGSIRQQSRMEPKKEDAAWRVSMNDRTFQQCETLKGNRT